MNITDDDFAPIRFEKPKNIQIENADFGLAITRKWFTLEQRWLGILLTVLWNAFFLFLTILSIIYLECSMAGGMFLFLVAGGAIAYSIRVDLVNKTEIKIDTDNITITHGPLKPITKNLIGDDKQVPVTEIAQLYTREFTSRRQSTRRKSVTRIYHEVWYKNSEDLKFKLLTGLPSFHEAQFLKQIIEEYLKKH